jgi:hypothetical protein
VHAVLHAGDKPATQKFGSGRGDGLVQRVVIAMVQANARAHRPRVQAAVVTGGLRPSRRSRACFDRRASGPAIGSSAGGGCGPMLAVPSRVSQRLPHLWAHDFAEIDAEVREALTEIGDREANQWSA